MGHRKEPLLSEFLVGDGFARDPQLQVAILNLCIVTAALPAAAWVAVLRVVARQPGCDEVVLRAAEKHASEQGVRDWIVEAILDGAVPLVTRLRLHLLSQPCVPFPAALAAAAEEALLAGAPLSAEPLKLLATVELWGRALRGDAHLAAAALVELVPVEKRACLEVDAFLQRGLVHTKRLQRRACLEVLRSVHGVGSAAFLTLLSEAQPLHLIDALSALPPGQFHDVAALLAVGHQDDRVAQRLLGRLSLSTGTLLGALALAASKHSASRKPPAWVAEWASCAGQALRGQNLSVLIPLFERPFAVGSLTRVLQAWEAGGFDAVATSSPDASVVRSLRRHAPEVAARLAAHLLSSSEAWLDSLFFELVLCVSKAIAQKLPVERVEQAASPCEREKLLALAELVPAAVARMMVGADAATALWAIGALPDVVVRGDAHGFALELLGCGPPFAQTSWAAARAACAAEPRLAANYPSSDPDYSSSRSVLLELGPWSAVHVGVDDGPNLLALWGLEEMERGERFAWLAAATRILQTAGSSNCATLASAVKATAVVWASKAGKDKDRALASSVLAALVAAGSGPDVFTAVWPSVRSCGGVAREAVGMLYMIEALPSDVLDTVLASSALGSELASASLRAKEPHLPTLVALAVRATAGGAQEMPADHPAMQLCSAVRGMTLAQRAAVLTQLMLVERPGLPVEGSPKGEAHQCHVRFWLCVGALLEEADVDDKHHQALAREVGEAAEQTVRKGGALPATRILLQNVWARALRVAPSVLLPSLIQALGDPTLPENTATPCVAVAAQLLLHPLHGNILAKGDVDLPAKLSSPTPKLDESDLLRPLLIAIVGWSTSYVQKPRLLASLALYHALDRGLIACPGWYLLALKNFVALEPAFQRFRERVGVDTWISEAWEPLRSQALRGKLPLDAVVAVAHRHASAGFLAPTLVPCVSSVQQADSLLAGNDYQRRPEPDARTMTEPGTGCGAADVIVVGSFLDNLPNMAGLVRTAEALLGSRAEVALPSEKVLSDPSFLKMSVAAEKAGRVVAVPEGPRLVAYLREKRAEGYVIYALEQTSASILLDASVTLPRRMVILVGGEQQGVPSWLVQSGLVDRFLELRLRGRTQSLNAHVTAAMLMWQYCLQH